MWLTAKTLQFPQFDPPPPPPPDKSLVWGLPVFSKMYNSTTLAQRLIVLIPLSHQASCQTAQFTERLQDTGAEVSWGVQILDENAQLFCADAPEPRLISVVRASQR